MQAADGSAAATRVAEELYRFTERLYRAETQHDVYEAALDIITRALGCRRASILLFDDAGIMRFAAWRGLSDGYRRALEGHSPWTRDAKEPQPVCIEDIEGASFPEALKETIKAEQIGALAFVPLVANTVLIGKFMTYYAARHAFSDAELALSLTIARQFGFSLERRRAEEALRETQRQLESELAATRQLHQISTQLTQASNPEALYEKILEAATTIMRSDFASMQMLCPERGELRLLAHRGFDPAAAARWEWVRPGSGTSCSMAMDSGCRSIVPDIELNDFIARSADLEPLRQTGIRAMQSTPLFSRAGGLLGMISTHWRRSHEPSERDLRLLDVVARQAADLIERRQAELALAERNIQLALAGKAALVGSYAYDAGTETMQISEGYVAIHGFPEGSTEIGRSECLAGVHPDDIGRVEEARSEAFRACRREYGVEYRITRPGGEMRWVETRCFIAYSGEGRADRVIGVSIDITERKRVEEQQRKLLAELDHRVKNVLATVQAVATHTMQASSSMEQFASALDGRIRSMGSTHELLSHRRWLGIPLAELVERELAPYATGSNTDIGGPEVTLSAEASQTIGMVLHELATNAAKHGALSVPSGRVAIRWCLPHNGASDRLVLAWRETGGPAVAPPSRSSYGMHVVRDLIPYELGGTVEHVLAPEGAQCHMEFPLARLNGGGSSQDNSTPTPALGWVAHRPTLLKVGTRSF
jgi:PAS domain S-box-containing protein